MKRLIRHTLLVAGISQLAAGFAIASSNPADKYTFKAGDPSLREWLLPDVPPTPADNPLTRERIELGKTLFFDPRLSGDGTIACASCHSPMFGWSDGLPTGKGFQGQVLNRASPTIVNTAFNSIQMWDGRKRSLEDQALGPMETSAEMNMDLRKLFSFLKSSQRYRELFARAYPGEPIGGDTVAKAIASYERTIVSNDSPFDRWVKGDANAMTPAQVDGFKVFVDKDKGNCAACHQGGNFTDNGFHNLGLASYGKKNPDMGRYAQLPLKMMKGAFKTPTLRDIDRTAPYFHDGSAKTLEEVVAHYVDGGHVKKDLDPNMKPLKISKRDERSLVAFMHALTTAPKAVSLPNIPLD